MPRKHVGKNPGATIGAGVGDLAAAVNAGQVIGGQVGQVIGGGQVILISRKPRIAVAMTLRRPVTPPVPRPKYTVTDRPATVGLTQWEGRDPFLLTLPVMFDELPTFSGVEDEIRTLESLAVRHKGLDGPPVLQTIGPVPNPIGVSDPRWRITGFTELPERTEFNDNGRRCRWAVDIDLIEHVRDEVLEGSIDRTIEPVGLTNDVTTVRDGETNLHKLAKRVYGDRSKAKDIARANGFNLAIRLKPGTHVKLP